MRIIQFFFISFNHRKVGLWFVAPSYETNRGFLNVERIRAAPNCIVEECRLFLYRLMYSNS